MGEIMGDDGAGGRVLVLGGGLLNGTQLAAGTPGDASALRRARDIVHRVEGIRAEPLEVLEFGRGMGAAGGGGWKKTLAHRF